MILGLRKYERVFLTDLVKKLASVADEFVIFVQDWQGNELYTVEDITEAPFVQVLVADADEYEVGGRKRVEVTVISLKEEDDDF